MSGDLAAYRKALNTKAWRVRILAGRIQHTEDSGLILDLSRKLRTAAREMRDLVHAHVVANRQRRAGLHAAGQQGAVERGTR